jgi:hypothetical protein
VSANKTASEGRRPLFRPRALERFHGAFEADRPLTLIRPGRRLALAGVALLVAGAALFLTLGTYAAHVEAPAVLVAREGQDLRFLATVAAGAGPEIAPGMPARVRIAGGRATLAGTVTAIVADPAAGVARVSIVVRAAAARPVDGSSAGTAFIALGRRSPVGRRQR